MGAEVTKRKREGKMVIQTNHFLTDDDKHLNPSEEFADRYGEVWVYDSWPRYNARDRRLTRLPRSIIEAFARLQRPPVTTERTMQQMVFVPATGRYRLKVRV
jgi:hypothetical protein